MILRCWQPLLEEKPGSSMIRDLQIIKIKYFNMISTRDMYVTRNTCNYMMHQDGLNIHENKLCSENKHFPVSKKKSTQTKPNINTWNIFNIQYNAITSGEKDSESILSIRSLLVTKRRKEFWFGPSGIKGSHPWLAIETPIEMSRNGENSKCNLYVSPSYSAHT